MTAFSGCAGLSKTSHTPPSATPDTAAPVATPDTAAPVAKPDTAATVAKPPAAAPAAKPPAIAAADKLFSEGMTALQEGGHERALELFSAAWQEKPGHAGVAREFDGALLALKKNGDAAYAQGKWEDAGKRWMGTLRFITHPAANSGGLPFPRSEVRTKVDRLSAALTEKALTEYRRGEIPAAIADWKTILSYDPGHEEAARSLRTALQQLETLKKLPPGK
jgi:tetratricopeptide (TPR) repeat protein